MTRVAVVASHPVQYYGPLFRALARRVDLKVLFCHKATPQDQARAGFGTAFDWDIDITSGFCHEFLVNVARQPGTDHFGGCDTPGVGTILRDGGFDAVIVTGWHLKSYVQGLLAAKRLGLPVLVRGDSHLATPRSGFKRAVKALAYPAMLRQFDAALYVGAWSRAYYLHYGFPQERLFFSPHAVDTAWFAVHAGERAQDELRASFGISQRSRVALFAGKLVSFKRPMDLVEAAARCRWRGAEIEVMIAGDGELRGALEERAKELDVPLHMLGFCNQSRMPAAYAAADVLVLPSEGETWGLVANEALACGRPIIVSDACGCAADLTVDGCVGRSYPVGDVGTLADAMAEVLRNPLDLGAIAALSQRYSLDAAVDGIFAGLGAAMKRRQRNAA